MAKIWERRIMAGTQVLANCPARYRDAVIALLRLEDKEDLKALVEQGLMTEAEYEEITGEPYA